MVKRVRHVRGEIGEELNIRAIHWGERGLRVSELNNIIQIKKKKKKKRKSDVGIDPNGKVMPEKGGGRERQRERDGWIGGGREEEEREFVRACIYSSTHHLETQMCDQA